MNWFICPSRSVLCILAEVLQGRLICHLKTFTWRFCDHLRYKHVLHQLHPVACKVEKVHVPKVQPQQPRLSNRWRQKVERKYSTDIRREQTEHAELNASQSYKNNSNTF